MIAPAQGPGELHDQVAALPASVSVLLATLAQRHPQRYFSRHPARAELAAGWGPYAPLTAVHTATEDAAPVSPVARRMAHYTAQRAIGRLDGEAMYAVASYWPARDREEPDGPVVAECGWTDYIDAAAIRMLTQGEGA